MDNIYLGRVELVRTMMRARGWDAVIISGTDPHSSEYPAPRWQQVRWVSGFTGETGDIVITLDHAGLWTDTRYFIQAAQQLAGTGIVLHKTRVPDQVLIPQWLSEHFEGDSQEVLIAVDSLCQDVHSMEELSQDFRIIGVPDMLSALWKDRPSIPCTPVFTLDEEYVGESRTDRISRVQDAIARAGCDTILLSELDDIAWVLNVRGSDIEYNPFVISYLLISQGDVRWFVLKDGAGEGSEEAFREVRADGVRILPYSDLEMVLGGGSEELGVLGVDGNTLNWALMQTIRGAGTDIVMMPSPVKPMKAVKNGTEISGMRKAHLLDGIAMERFLHWLEHTPGVNEWEAASKLGELRAAAPEYMGDSFETISAYGPGAALPHYITPRSEDAPLLEPHGLYLCDSGGQYLCGTTDITRTVPLGECTPAEMEDYTLVLKGHIDLAMAVFPAGTPGCRLDALSREPLWKARRNFGHGTGHGIGFFLGVHEGPQDIRQNLNPQPLEEGMITSDEPGIYIEGQYGVRHENLLLCRDAGENEFGKWLEFETLTLCHFDTSAVVRELLTREEAAWLNDYNERVYLEISPYLTPDEAVWLREKTLPV